MNKYYIWTSETSMHTTCCAFKVKLHIFFYKIITDWQSVTYTGKQFSA